MDQRNAVPVTRSEFEGLALFHKVSFESVAGYLLGKEPVIFEPDTVLISPLNANSTIFIVLGGTLEVRLETPDGILVGTLQQGDCAGEMSVFDNEDPSAWVITRDTSRILVLERDLVLAMLHASHDFCLNILHILSQRLRFNNRVMTADRHHIRRIEEYATVDALTGLHNRRWMQNMFDRELQRSKMGNIPLAALMLDIDFFKKVNDDHGHLAGDAVLAVVAQATSMSLRPSDMVVRYGGEEIAIFLPNTQTADALNVAERVRAAVEARPIDLPEGGFLRVTVSIGIAQIAANDTVDLLLDRADKGLYEAKHTGRNRCILQAS
jgi:diguanylate cyclase (GGDEF)-like protein